MKKRATSLVTVIAAAFACVAFVVALGTQAAYAKTQTLSSDVGKLLQESVALTKQSPPDWGGALDKAKQAQALPKQTPFDTMKIDDVLAMIYINQHDYKNAADVYEAAYLTMQWPPEEKANRLKTLVQLEYQIQDYTKAMTYADQYTKEVGPDFDVQAVVTNIYYIQKDYTKGLASAQDLISRAQASGTKVQESWWELLLYIASAAKNDSAVMDALYGLADNYPSKEVWHDLAGNLYNRPNRSDHYALSCLRLMLAADAMKASEEYLSAAQLALNSGLAGEAKKIIQAGDSAGILPGKEKTLEATLKGQAAADSKGEPGTLDAKDKASAASKSAGSDIAIGEAFAVYGLTDKAVAAINRGLARTGAESLRVPDEGRVSLGWAYFIAGKFDDAKAAFASVKTDQRSMDLARAWLALIKAKTTPASAPGASQ